MRRVVAVLKPGEIDEFIDLALLYSVFSGWTQSVFKYPFMDVLAARLIAFIRSKLALP